MTKQQNKSLELLMLMKIKDLNSYLRYIKDELVSAKDLIKSKDIKIKKNGVYWQRKMKKEQKLVLQALDIKRKK